MAEADPSRPAPFATLAASLPTQSTLRDAITQQYRAPEADCVQRLLAMARRPVEETERAQQIAARLVTSLRAKGSQGAVAGLVREYDLSSQEGVALMCLAEALLRIPDRATRDALIRDKISPGDWRAHLGQSQSLFVNAATWGLVVTGKLTASNSEAGLSSALSRLIGRGGEPLIRKGVDLAMRMMGEQFVTGQTIREALTNSRRLEARGFRYSYDMLGEAATTAADADRYFRDYETAINAIGAAAAKRGIYEGPGISIKLSALHPRYTRAQRPRVMAELLPRLTRLAVLARRYDIGLNIDAEEADRLELSLDLLEGLCFAEDLRGWDGIGFVVQAYQKRASFVLDWMIDLARRSDHRLMVRLVKGAYWDSEIKRAQVDGLRDFPVFTRKRHTDVSYLACAKMLLDAPDQIFPQFATHNAQTVAAIFAMAGDGQRPGHYEFQCLHGMGEPLYEDVVGPDKLNRPCRIYAPVGTHETLLAYLVRRLLENGANSSFVNRILDPGVSVDDLIADPVARVLAEHPVGAPHPKIALPRDILGASRPNSAGLDLSDEHAIAALVAGLVASAAAPWRAGDGRGEATVVRDPADHRDIVGYVRDATADEVETALRAATAAAASWQATAPVDRAACLLRAADIMEARMARVMGLIVREAGKSLPNAISEIREAVDFLRYYAAQVRDGFDNATHPALGLTVCISPWNFPLAIFTGQVAAALAAGNTVLAKPAEETPLTAAAAVAILHEAGIPAEVVQLIPGRGEVGARLVGDRRSRAVLFTGSTDVARLIQAQLAERLNPDGSPVPLVAETGGQNALVVDSSALAEQVVADVLVSAFDSAGQRCSALRVLCLQVDNAERIMTMLKGALAELSMGNPDDLSTDIGPVISHDARDRIGRHVEEMRDKGFAVHQAPIPDACAQGTFIAPTIIEVGAFADLTHEVFGPVLHVIRYRRQDLAGLIRAINASGYGLTFGVHSRIDETIALVTERIDAGNIYVNRNLIGAVVGVQPFGGHGLSGTGPKAGGPLYLQRLVARSPMAEATASVELAGPVGERNLYSTMPRGTVLCVATTEPDLRRQIEAAQGAGNHALVEAGALRGLAGPRVSEQKNAARGAYDVVLFKGPPAALLQLGQDIAQRPGPIVSIYTERPDGSYAPLGMIKERSVSTNTTAAGGNANLMMLGQ